MFLTNQDLLEAVFNDTSKYRQAIDSGYIRMATFLAETMLIDNVLFFFTVISLHNVLKQSIIY